MANKGALFIISAPSGAGKTTLVRALTKSMTDLAVSVSYTTRAMRTQEQDGSDYHFVSHSEFSQMLKEEIFLEYAQVFGHFYGTSRVWVEETREKGLDVILEIDWQGARQVRSQFVEAHCIFILPPSREALFDRLQKRHPENRALVEERMSDAKEEISRYNEYDYLVCNDRFEEALEDIQSIIRSHRLQWRRQQVKHSTLIDRLLS